MSMNGGGSKSKSRSGSSSEVWGEQSPYLTDLYGRGTAAMDGANGNVASGMASAVDFAKMAQGDLYNPALASYQQQFGANNNMSRASDSTMQGMTSSLNQMMNGDPVNNPYLQQNVQRAIGDVADNFNKNIMPSLRTEAAHMGQYGGSRHGIAEGLAASEANKQATDIAGQMYSQAYDQGMQNRLSAASMAGGLVSGAASNAAQGIQSGQALANLGMAPANAYMQAAGYAFQPLQYQSSIVGGPTVLTDSYSRSSSKQFSGGGGMG